MNVVRRIFKKEDGRVCQMVHLERDRGSVTFVRIKVIFQVFDQLVTFFKPACLMYEDVTAHDGVIKKLKKGISQRVREITDKDQE